jgi:hypothetical protein
MAPVLERKQQHAGDQLKAERGRTERLRGERRKKTEHPHITGTPGPSGGTQESTPRRSSPKQICERRELFAPPSEPRTVRAPRPTGRHGKGNSAGHQGGDTAVMRTGTVSEAEAYSPRVLLSRCRVGWSRSAAAAGSDSRLAPSYPRARSGGRKSRRGMGEQDATMDGPMRVVVVVVEGSEKGRWRKRGEKWWKEKMNEKGNWKLENGRHARFEARCRGP